MAYFIYIGHGKYPPLATKAFGVFFERNGHPQKITDENYANKLRYNPSFAEFFGESKLLSGADRILAEKETGIKNIPAEKALEYVANRKAGVIDSHDSEIQKEFEAYLTFKKEQEAKKLKEEQEKEQLENLKEEKKVSKAK